MTMAAILNFQRACSLVGLWQRIMKHKLFGQECLRNSSLVAGWETIAIYYVSGCARQ